jgi:hypothetical protein
MFAHAIAEVSSARKGFHVLWAGPRAWLYSPTGWQIQRRLAGGPRDRPDCLLLGAPELATLRARHELAIRFGLVRQRGGEWPHPLVPPPAARAPMARIGLPPPPEVFTLELAEVRSWVRVLAVANACFAVALRDGKAVAGGRVTAGNTAHDLAAPEIDTVVVYTRAATALQFCQRADAAWDDAPVVKRLQLPIRELMPALTTPADELAEARSRLVSGESLDAGEFHAFADVLRAVVLADGPPRPIDLALLQRPTTDDSFEETSALDPIRALLPHPRWRRVLGMAWFDGDPALVAGSSYEYRVSGSFPAVDLSDRVFGFHTVPTQTAVPAEFYLGGLRVRLPQPARIDLPSEPRTGLRAVTRHGIALAPRTEPWWQVPSIDDHSVVLDFPSEVLSVVLELAPGHDLRFAGGAPWLPPPPMLPVPPGARPVLEFGAPIHQLRLSGTGFLHAVRVTGPTLSTGGGLRPQASITGAIALVDTPLPAPPLLVQCDNLQAPDPIPVTDQPDAPTLPREALGFRITWRPAPIAGVIAWPPDLDAAPLIDAALFQIEHDGGSGWGPVIEEENWTAGDREAAPSVVQIHAGADLLAAYPEIRAHSPGSLDLHWRDVFDFDSSGEDTGVRRPVPAPGTMHRYRVRAVDAIGRASATATESPARRLEKHTPPPPPAAPDLTPADQLAQPAPSGVQARAIVRDAPELTDADRALLGAHGNAIVLRWGWHDEQRALDPFATEFRVYLTREQLGFVDGVLASVTSLGGALFDAQLALVRPIAGDLGAGAILTAGARFRVLGHDAGANVAIHLRAIDFAAGGAAVAPTPGAVSLPVRITPDRTRAPAWGPRVAIQAIDARTVYEVVLFDRLDLRVDHPRDALFVGVSAADAQSYVPDPLAPADSRPGNESAIVAVRCEARWQGRPVVTESPPLGPVPVIVAPEPGGRPVGFRLDPAPLLAGVSLAGNRGVFERVSDDDVFRAYRTDGGRILARVVEPVQPGDVEHEIVVGNAADRAAILAALAGGELAALEDRHVVFLAASQPYRARLYRHAHDGPIALGPFSETLPHRSARWVYRVRLADGDRLSQDGVTLPGIVRVPAMSRLAPPVREDAAPGDPRDRLRVRAAGAASALVVFTVPGPAGEAELLRIASGGRALPDGVRLRVGDALIAPRIVSLTGADVVVAGPYRHAAIDFAAGAGADWQVWAAVASADGVLSPLAGPWRVRTPLAPLIAPVATLTGAPPLVTLHWSWPAGAEPAPVMVERSADGARFDRISPPLPSDRTSHAIDAPAGSWRYRLRARSLDGREAVSNEVTS